METVYRKGKQTWVKAFLASSKDVIDSLNMLASNEYSELSMPGIEKLFISVFCPQTKIKTISHGRWYLFKKNNADCEKPLPTTGALLQHVKRAKLQAMIWGAAYKNIVPGENPVEYGWIMSSNNMHKPVLTLDAIAPESVLKISKCKCETGCKVKYNRCPCVKGGVSCDVLCECSETCENTDLLVVSIETGEEEHL